MHFTDTCVQHMGPTNITRSEGERNVFIPCPLSGLVLPIWKINGYFYELYQLPEQYTPAYGGVYIQIISRQLNGTTFQCFTQNGNAYILEASSIGILTVVFFDTIDTKYRKQDTCLLTTCTNDPFFSGIIPRLPFENEYLYLDHQNMKFDKNITLTWKRTSLDCITFKIIFRKECGYISQPNKTYEVSSSKFDIYVESETSVDISVESVNDHGILCQTMKETIQIHKPGNVVLQE